MSSSPNAQRPNIDTAKLYELTGTIDKITYQTPAGFVIIKFKNSDNGKVTTALGNTKSEIRVGSEYKLKARATWNEKYAEINLKIEELTCTEEWTERGIEIYLANECAHLGPAKAKLAAKAFGKGVFDVIIKNPQKLCDVIPHFTLEKAQAVSVWMKSQQKIQFVKQELYDVGMTPGLVDKVVKQYGSNAMQAVRDDCFQLIAVDGVGFLTASKIADKLGVASDDPHRVQEGILYTINEVVKNGGHTCIEPEDLVRESCKLIGVNKDVVQQQILELQKAGKLCTEQSDPAAYSRNPDLFQEGAKKDVVKNVASNQGHQQPAGMAAQDKGNQVVLHAGQDTAISEQASITCVSNVSTVTDRNDRNEFVSISSNSDSDDDADNEEEYTGDGSELDNFCF